MKKRIVFLGIVLVLLNSCIVKSLHPFYTKNTISYQEELIGSWTDDDKSKWEITSFKEKYVKDHQKNKVSELSKKQLKKYNIYKDAYLVSHTKEGKKADFIAVPFRINEQLFLDFFIYEIEGDNINELALVHLTFAHSIAKFDIHSKTNIIISWLDEDKIQTLLDNNKIKIKYEKVGFDDEYILTASSQELQKFVKKYMASDDSEKWSVKANLTRNNG